MFSVGDGVEEGGDGVEEGRDGVEEGGERMHSCLYP